jgi:hypothetical protein
MNFRVNLSVQDSRSNDKIILHAGIRCGVGRRGWARHGVARCGLVSRGMVLSDRVALATLSALGGNQ